MVSNLLFKDRDGQTPLPPELRKGLKPKNIQTIGDLDEYEEKNITDGLIWLSKQNQKIFDRYFWFRLHKRLFGKVWSWAGEVRTHDLNNPDFVIFPKIQEELKTLETHIVFWVENETYETRNLIARIHERLLTIHPFANGNGRFSRILCEKFCQEIGVQAPSWGRGFSNDPRLRRRNYIDALEDARQNGKYLPLEEFIFDLDN